MQERKILELNSTMDMYLQLVELTEPPLLFHRWAFISIIATCLSKKIWLPFGHWKIYPNQFIILVGPPGSRKSTAINIASSLLTDSGYEHFVGSKSSREKFLSDFEFGFDRIYRGEKATKKEDRDSIEGMLEGDYEVDKDKISEAYIKAGELQNFLGGGNSAFISTLTDLWDKEEHYSDRFKNSPSIFIPNPIVNMIGGATITSFASMFSSNIIGQGMLSRMILVHGKGQRMKLLIPPPLPAAIKEDILKVLLAIRLDFRGEITLEANARAALDDIYEEFEDLRDARLTSYCSRRLIHLLKLCLVITASELTTTITESMVILGNTILTYTESFMSKALGEFGQARHSETSQIVFDAIANAQSSGGITPAELLKQVSQDIDSRFDLMNIVVKLSEAGRIAQGTTDKGSVWLPAKKLITTDSKYVDYNLLYEHKFKEAE